MYIEDRKIVQEHLNNEDAMQNNADDIGQTSTIIVVVSIPVLLLLLLIGCSGGGGGFLSSRLLSTLGFGWMVDCLFCCC